MSHIVTLTRDFKPKHALKQCIFAYSISSINSTLFFLLNCIPCVCYSICYLNFIKVVASWFASGSQWSLREGLCELDVWPCLEN